MRMPPKDSNKQPLSATEIETLRTWIANGAEYQPHWSIIAPSRPIPPDLKNDEFSRNAIDHFVLNRIRQRGWSPSPPADRRTLIRRVTLDLTGLPPTVDEVEAFLNDSSPDAYEKVVDRLLTSPHYGEHRARYWLDAVRYGDTHGLHLDNYREVWPYRDWVIRAMNQNMPFDQFTIDQVAGDLLPDPTLDDLVASGFNRMNLTTSEGGSIPEEVEVRNVIDRVSTTGTVFLGLTVGCAVCHDHKYDPITQEDFYSLYAFFNNIDADPLDGNAKDPAPIVRVPTAEQATQLVDLDQQIKDVQTKIDAPNPDLDAAEAAWVAEWTGQQARCGIL